MLLLLVLSLTVLLLLLVLDTADCVVVACIAARVFYDMHVLGVENEKNIKKKVIHF